MEVFSRRELVRRSSAGALVLASAGAPSALAAYGSSPPAVGERPARRPAELRGRVVRPGDAGYTEARKGWNGLFDRYPLAIVFCRSAADVVEAIAWAGQNDVALRARCGRHSLEGWSGIDGGLVIDVSELKQVRIDANP